MPHSTSKDRRTRRRSRWPVLVFISAWAVVLLACGLSYWYGFALSWNRLSQAGTDVRYRMLALSLDHGAIIPCYFVKDEPWSQWAAQGWHDLATLQRQVNGFGFEHRPKSATYPNEVPPFATGRDVAAARRHQSGGVPGRPLEWTLGGVVRSGRPRHRRDPDLVAVARLNPTVGGGSVPHVSTSAADAAGPLRHLRLRPPVLARRLPGMWCQRGHAPKPMTRSAPQPALVGQAGAVVGRVVDGTAAWPNRASWRAR